MAATFVGTSTSVAATAVAATSMAATAMAAMATTGATVAATACAVRRRRGLGAGATPRAAAPRAREVAGAEDGMVDGHMLRVLVIHHRQCRPRELHARVESGAVLVAGVPAGGHLEEIPVACVQ